jgi:hypothetical protein
MEVALALIVMPFSRYKSIESIDRSTTAWLSRYIPLACRWRDA